MTSISIYSDVYWCHIWLHFNLMAKDRLDRLDQIAYTNRLAISIYEIMLTIQNDLLSWENKCATSQEMQGEWILPFRNSSVLSLLSKEMINLLVWYLSTTHPDHGQESKENVQRKWYILGTNKNVAEDTQVVVTHMGKQLCLKTILKPL